MIKIQSRFILIIRHGELYNPNNIVYNRDEVMRSEDIMHLSQKGKEQLINIGKVIKYKKFNVVGIWHSPQIRALESTNEINKILKLGAENIKSDSGINELYAPGGYREGIDLTVWEKAVKGNAYDKKRWSKYNHEEPKDIVNRFSNSFWKIACTLKIGEAGILISHGDPIAWFLNNIITGKIPDPRKLRELIYPAKGQATVFEIDRNNKILNHYLL